MASPEHTSSQPAVSSSAVAGGARSNSPSEQAQALARKELALMICVHEYPLSIVEHALFLKFCKTLHPLFKMVCRNTIRKDILEMHAAQKELMVRYFANLKYRVAITSDMWTVGHHKKGYMVVTAHYIDESWNLKSFLLRAQYPNDYKLDIIGWWKFGGIKYPTLQRMAHDILPIPVTIVASESAFSTSGRVLSAHRGSLAPNMAEALMCMQAWSRADMLGDCNSSLYADFQSVLADEEEPMDEDVSILTEE